MSFARARARKSKKARKEGDERGRKKGRQIINNVNMTYVDQLRLAAQCRNEVMENLYLLLRYTMHTRFGFGASRLTRLKNKLWKELDAIDAGNVKVHEIQMFLYNEMHFSCNLTKVDKNANIYKQVEDDAIQRLAAAFFMAMIDEFGWGAVRLQRVSHQAFLISKMLENGEIEYSDMRKTMEDAMAKANKRGFEV